MDAVDRIFELVGEKFKEQKEFASALRVNDKTVSAWRTRRAKSYTKYLPQIAEAWEPPQNISSPEKVPKSGAHGLSCPIRTRSARTLSRPLFLREAKI